MFYNVENLFDAENDPVTEDDEFCPGGMRNWNNYRLKVKLNQISKVVMAANGFEPPVIIGLCEVENRHVLERLLSQTPLGRFNYRIVHKNSPDKRGIDVAMLYRADKLVPLRYKYHPLIDGGGDTLSSREILESSFGTANDTLHVLVNHWPSRYRGQAETESDRLLAATQLRNVVESIYRKEPKAKIIILGDFNDQPDNASLKNGLNAVVTDHPEQEGELVNLSAQWKPKGTLKHQQSWQIFDQIIVSDFLLSGEKLSCTPADTHIVEFPFLFEEDSRWGGKRLFRTYRGYRYTGGFSDHLPVVLRIHTIN
ncbi:endonuclease/exonuclease/phosphatase family protein [Mangrovibacterium lignilyticum]|uniref:endonuclease/exonuclease/phosphatase family protein n=1 Tax=Mangrovibacterium lignilyticum TaxID=2668052 RepID=UPI0013D29143|nr:endonuclease/exonuclease/phosphatase family protein [Mangrovibacterium lignilyticum]